MAFNVNEFVNKTISTQKQAGTFNVDEFIKNKKIEPIQTGNFDVNEFVKSTPTAVKKSSGNFGSSQELYNLAVQSGLQDKADKVLAEKGEDNKKIFSGGFISDIFDGLNALQYGVVGMLKGKGFAEGVKTRQSWSDKDALGDYGIPGMIGGIALDIACDPLTYIAPWTIAKKIPGIVKGAKALKTAVFGKLAEKVIPATEEIAEKTFKTIEGGTNVGKWLARKFQYMFGADPIYKEIYERSVKNIAVGDSNITKLVQGVIDIPKEKAAQLLTKDKTGRFIRRSLDELKDVLTPEEFTKVSNAYTHLDDLGKQAVDVGLLNKATYEENIGEYIKNAYSEFETTKSKGVFGFIKQKVAGIKARKTGLTPKKMTELGQIDNPAYLLLKSSIDLTHDIENTKLFNQVAEKFASNSFVEGMAKKVIPNTKSYGALAGKYVPEFIYDNLTEIGRVKTPLEKGLNKIVGGFKYAKVILNPATHARNVASNEILNWWKLGLGPWRQDIYAEAIKNITKGGRWIDEAKSVGYGLDTYAANEIKNLLVGPESNKVIGKIKGLGNKIANIYQGEENLAKLSAFIFKRKAGMRIEDAWKAAESATFNYAQVTPFVRRLRESMFGFPFITFTVKSTPTAIETALKTPGRVSVFGKIKQAIESQSDLKETARERASEPSWIKDGFYIKLPMKDKYGRSAYFDLTYIIPFGDLMSGNFGEGVISRETGLKEGAVQTMARKAPFFNLVKELTSNQDFYGDKIWQDGDSQTKQLGDIMRHLTKTYMPPLIADQIPGGHVQTGQLKGKRRQKGIISTLKVDEKNAEQQRTLMEEMIRQVGIKIQPINVDIQETYMETEKKKALQTILKEAGILSDFTVPYKTKSP
jgi:hypothetical protein